MLPRTILVFAAALALGVGEPAVARAQSPVPLVPLTPGMVITSSVNIQPGRYELSAPPGTADSMGFASPRGGLIRIIGHDITIDFKGAELIGSPAGMTPDQFGGIAIEIEGGHDITIKNARIRGYKIAIMAHDTRRLTIADNELSYNWKPRLYSERSHESLVDWLYFHHDEHDEWRRYGAAIYLDRVSGGEIRGNTATQGMNGLLIARSGDLQIWNNNFSYLSGVGIGLYRSNRNRIMHNRVDYCVRGFSFGHYNRGQDSAALLMFEQSSDNVVAYNSMTHGGDGLFLWAGQYTMDTGAGGSNDNLFYGNDFSHAVTNGMEATFSRNKFVANRVDESWHGLWGGYSWDSEILGNRFARNQVGIAIEHGQKIRIAGNVFNHDTLAIRLWGDSIEPSDWGYPKHRDTRSRDYRITDNFFLGNRVGVALDATPKVEVQLNRFAAVDTLTRLSGDTSDWKFRSNAVSADPVPLAIFAALPPEAARYAPEPMPDGMNPMIPEGGRRGRATILIDEWGPYDWRAPRAWPVTAADSGPVRLRVVGPPGRWVLLDEVGVANVSATSGTIPGMFDVTPKPGAALVAVALRYLGGPVTAADGEVTPAGAPYRFGWWRFEPATRWDVRFVSWDSASDPRSDSAAFAQRLNGPAVARENTARLDYLWYRPSISGVPAERFAVKATQSVDLPPGQYHLRTISDDGIRVWVDGRLAIDHWTPHESRVDTTAITAGHHDIRVEYYQVDGWTELRVEVVPDEAPLGIGVYGRTDGLTD